MLRGLVGSRVGRRVIAVLVIAVLVVASLAIYLQMAHNRSVNPLTKPGGAGYVSGFPDAVNLTTQHTWFFPLELVVTESYLSGITFKVTANSTFSGAGVYFTSTGSNWRESGGNLTMESTLSYYAAGSTDRNLTLVVTGDVNATGWIGVSVSSVLGKVTPSFQKIDVFGYSGVQPPAEQYIRFDNLPAELTVNSSSSGTYGILYSAKGVTGGIEWQSSVPWLNVTTVDGTHASASYSAPDVSANSTFAVNLTATSGNGVTNSSTVTFHVVVNATGPAAPGSISFSNLPAALTVDAGSSGSYTINYTAENLQQEIHWSTNVSWVTVTTLNSTAAVASYSAPDVSANTTIVVNVNASAGNVYNSSTLTFTVIVPYHVPQPEIRLLNLPSTLTVPSGSSGTFVIRFATTGAAGELAWTSSLPWVTIATTNATAADANYTAPAIGSSLSQQPGGGQQFQLFTVEISVTSSGGASNSSTLTFNVTAPVLPAANATVTTLLQLNGSALDVQINGGIHLNITVPAGVSNESLLIYTSIAMNNSVLCATINGGIHVSVIVPAGVNLTIYTYTLIHLSNSSLSVDVNGALDISLLLAGAASVSIVNYVNVTGSNFSISGGVPDAGKVVTALQGGGSEQGGSYAPIYTSLYLNNSTMTVRIDGGVRLAFSLPGTGGQGVTQLYTHIALNNSHLELKIHGGVTINLLAYGENQSALYTSIQLNDSSAEIEVNRIVLPPGRWEVDETGGTGMMIMAYDSHQTQNAGQRAVSNPPSMIKLAFHCSKEQMPGSSAGSAYALACGVSPGLVPSNSFSGPPPWSGSPEAGTFR